MAYVRRTVAAAPGWAVAWLGLALAHADAGGYPDAVDTLVLGLEREPGPEDARAMRAELERLRPRLAAVSTAPASRAGS